jgi:hypothetical protein
MRSVGGWVAAAAGNAHNSNNRAPRIRMAALRFRVRAFWHGAAKTRPSSIVHRPSWKGRSGALRVATTTDDGRIKAP